MSEKITKAILLVAGEGTRLRPYTLDRPKCLVEIEGKSLLDRQLAVLKSEGINTTILVGGYKAEMLKHKGSKLVVNSRYACTNMLWSLFCAEEELEGSIIVSYGDIVYSKKILYELLTSSADIAVAIDQDWESYWRLRNENPLADAESLKLSHNGVITEIGKLPVSIDEIEGQYMGLLKLTSNGVSIFKKYFHDAKKQDGILGKPIEKAYLTDFLQHIIERNIPVQSVPVTGDWVEVDTVSDYELEVTRQRLMNIQAEKTC